MALTSPGFWPRAGRWLLRHAGRAPLLIAFVWLIVIGLAVAGRWRPGSTLVVLLFLSFFAATILAVWARWQHEVAVREAALPQFLKRKLRETYPHLTGKDCDLVERGLRQFFLACLRSRNKFVAMPSRVVDAMWHEFILHTRGYRDWCELALGRFLHHTPAEVLGPNASTNDGLRRAWYWACRDEAIDPRRPSRLPLLFALDAKLAIANGFVYRADCRGAPFADPRAGDGTAVYCGTSFCDDSFSGDADGLGGADASGSGDGDGGGDGGDGGGCGGGGD